MNFLAHAYLSFGEPEIIVGNLIADSVRGKQIYNLPQLVQQGVRMHRLIDEYTDAHVVNQNAKLIFRDVAGRYDAAFLDVAYDHFLAVDGRFVPYGGWQSYAQHCYNAVEKHGGNLPQLFCSMYVYMKTEDWLSTYDKKEMIAQSFERLAQRATYLDRNVAVFDVFLNRYELIQDAFSSFFPDLVNYVLSITVNGNANDC